MPLGHILTYYDGSQPHYTHLRASMLAYAHINLLSMLTRFRPKEVPQVAVDGIYVQTIALYKLKGVETYVAPDEHPEPPQTVVPAKRRDKGERLYMPAEHAAYLSKPEYKRRIFTCENSKGMPDSTAPRFDDPLTRYQLS